MQKARQRMAEILRILPGSSLVVAPSDTDLAAPEVAAGLEESFGGGGYTARQRAALLQLAADHVASALDGRESAFELHANGGLAAWRARLRRCFGRYNELANGVLHALSLEMPAIDLDSLRAMPMPQRRPVTPPSSQPPGGPMRPWPRRLTAVTVFAPAAGRRRRRTRRGRARGHDHVGRARHAGLALARPGETEGIITPFMVLYAAPRRAGEADAGAAINTPSLAESWTQSKDGLDLRVRPPQGRQVPQRRAGHGRGREVLLRPLPGRGAKLLKERVREVQIVDPGRVRFVLKEPWPDFMTFYGTSATGAGWIVPKKYVEKVGDDGFKKAPIGAGPYRFVELHPGRRAGDGGLRGVLAQGRQSSSGWSCAACPTRRRAPPRSRRARWTSPIC